MAILISLNIFIKNILICNFYNSFCSIDCFVLFIVEHGNLRIFACEQTFEDTGTYRGIFIYLFIHFETLCLKFCLERVDVSCQRYSHEF